MLPVGHPLARFTETRPYRRGNTKSVGAISLAAVHRRAPSPEPDATKSLQNGVASAGANSVEVADLGSRCETPRPDRRTCSHLFGLIPINRYYENRHHPAPPVHALHSVELDVAGVGRTADEGHCPTRGSRRATASGTVPTTCLASTTHTCRSGMSVIARQPWPAEPSSTRVPVSARSRRSSTSSTGPLRRPSSADHRHGA